MCPESAGPQTKYFTIATAGHVDHGKTSLLKALTGIDPDRLKEEKERQMTTDLGFAHLRLPDDVIVGFIDVPGHGKFLKNMLAGVGGIDLALLVVAADEGPMPQTEQHAKILSLLGVNRVLVAITKIDMVNKAQVETVIGRINTVLLRNFLKLEECVPVSNTEQKGFEELRTALKDALIKLPARQADGPAFLPVDRVFSKAGFGTVTTGTLVRGSLCTGDQVTIAPGNIQARVRRLESFGQIVEKALAGQRLACNLVVKDHASLARGHVVLSQAVEPTGSLLVSLAGLDKRSNELSDYNGQDIRLYHGTAECHGKIAWLEPLTLNESFKSGYSPQSVAQLSLLDPVVAEPSDRFVIRFSDDTVCGGTIIMHDKPRWLTRTKASTLAPLLLNEDFGNAIAAYIQFCPQHLVKEDHFKKFVPSTLLPNTLDKVISKGIVARLGDRIISPMTKAGLVEHLVSEISNWQRSKTNSASTGGAPLEHLRTRLTPAIDRPAFQMLVQELVSKNVVERHGDKLILTGTATRSANDPQMEILCKKITDTLSSHLCLEVEELARMCGAESKQTSLALQELSKRQEAELINYEFAALSLNISRAHQLLIQLWKEKQDISPADFRDALGTSRKYAMALLAYFDDRQITRRTAKGRALLRPPN